jgi:hypothetical protein
MVSDDGHFVGAALGFTERWQGSRLVLTELDRAGVDSFGQLGHRLAGCPRLSQPQVLLMVDDPGDLFAHLVLLDIFRQFDFLRA